MAQQTARQPAKVRTGTGMRILFAVDGSEQSARAVTFAAGLVPAGAQVRLLVVVGGLDYHPPVHYDGGAVAEQERSRALQTVVDRALAPALAALAPVGADVSVEQRFGYPQDEIVAAIQQWQPDLVVLGHRGLTGFAKWIESVSEKVLHRTDVAVLLVS